MKAKDSAGEKTKAKAKKPSVKAASKSVKRTAAAPKAEKSKAAGKKTGMGREIDRARAFFKSLTLNDVAKLGEEGMSKLEGMFAAISAFGRKLRENAKTKK
ncbi:MAG: hypothetical protein ABSB95_01630 [Dissulfurispiraceae bacterium]